MIKSTITLGQTDNGWALFQGSHLLVDGIATKREARTLLRQARAAERVANSYLRGVEASTGRLVCDIRCVSATGHDCQCQCAGANHGAAHAA